MNQEEKYWAIPVCWEMSGTVYIKAKSAQEAIDKFIDHRDEIDTPDDEQYNDDSFDLSCNEPESIEWHTEVMERLGNPNFKRDNYSF